MKTKIIASYEVNEDPKSGMLLTVMVIAILIKETNIVNVVYAYPYQPGTEVHIADSVDAFNNVANDLQRLIDKKGYKFGGY